MKKNELTSLPINEWADKNCFLWLWATNSKDKETGEPILRIAFDLLDTWEFKFYTLVTWNKKTGPCPFGSYLITTEYAWFSYKGKTLFSKYSLGNLQTCFSESWGMKSIGTKTYAKEYRSALKENLVALVVLS